MTQTTVKTGRVGKPDDDKRWWVVPTVATALTVPPGMVLGYLSLFGAMMTDSCDPGGCSAVYRWLYTLWGIVLVSPVPLVVCWVLPHRRSLVRLRVVALLAGLGWLGLEAYYMLVLPVPNP